MNKYLRYTLALVLASAVGIAAAELVGVAIGLARDLSLSQFPFRGVAIIAAVFSVLASVPWAVGVGNNRRDHWGVSIIFALGTGCMFAMISAIQFNRFNELYEYVLIFLPFSLICALSASAFMHFTGMCDEPETSNS